MGSNTFRINNDCLVTPVKDTSHNNHACVHVCVSVHVSLKVYGIK